MVYHHRYLGYALQRVDSGNCSESLGTDDTAHLLTESDAEVKSDFRSIQTNAINTGVDRNIAIGTQTRVEHYFNMAIILRDRRQC